MGMLVPPPPGHPNERELWESMLRYQRIQASIMFVALLAIIAVLMICLISTEGGGK